jgi:hypothetical protein
MVILNKYAIEKQLTGTREPFAGASGSVTFSVAAIYNFPPVKCNYSYGINVLSII